MPLSVDNSLQVACQYPCCSVVSVEVLSTLCSKVPWKRYTCRNPILLLRRAAYVKHRSRIVGIQLLRLAAQVRFNVQAALEGLGLVQTDTRQSENEVLEGVNDILAPVLNKTWPSGLPENN